MTDLIPEIEEQPDEGYRSEPEVGIKGKGMIEMADINLSLQEREDIEI
jgi:hypothetical protein